MIASKRGIVLFIFIIILPLRLLCVGEKGKFLIPSKAGDYLYEINRIDFVGNKSFTDEELESLINSRTTKRNTVHKIVDFYYSEFSKIKDVNKYLPPGAMATMRKVLKRWSPEIQYYEEAKVEADLEILREFYNQNGFHNCQISFNFKGDYGLNINILTFYVEEGERYKIQVIQYQGLDGIVEDVKKEIKRNQKIRRGDYFVEEQILNEISSIQQILLNNGYFYSYYLQPTVEIDTLYKVDSITVRFFPGERQKISSIVFVDSTFGQKVVTNKMKNNQLAFQVGDWYNRQKVEVSRQNLQGLGTFEFVSIDTSSSIGQITDSSLPFKVYTRYRKQQEWGFGFYYNRTTYDNFDNVGIEFSYLNRNIGGIAQSLNLFSRIEWQNISRYFSPEFEWQLGLSFAQPYLWRVGNSVVGLSSQLLHLESRINTYLQMSTSSFMVKLPVRLPRWTYFNGMSFDIFVDWQRPVNFLESKKKALDEAKTDSSKAVVEQTFKIYNSLYEFSKESHWYEPSALIFGINLIGDTRDELFSPTKGYFTNLSTDFWGGFGISKYLRLQYSYSFFTSLNKYTVFALKARTGYIYWFDVDNSYIPVEKQFFAGGANSVRGWRSRHLRYFTDRILFVKENTNLSFAEDFIGSRAILEGSFEVRWRFGRPRWASDVVGNIINMGVMTGFIDWGNTFNWIAFNDEEYYKDLKFLDYIIGLGVSVGLGFGIQTPVGPLRFDFALPVWDPTPENNLDKFVLSRSGFLEYFQYHIGLGYSF